MKLKHEHNLKSTLGYYKDSEPETIQQPGCKKLPSLFFFLFVSKSLFVDEVNV